MGWVKRYTPNQKQNSEGPDMEKIDRTLTKMEFERSRFNMNAGVVVSEYDRTLAIAQESINPNKVATPLDPKYNTDK